ncbi:hypothetical protein FIV42_05605 [Persicimonas caeni]|uniref:Lipocalin-like domain-containing protein n=1 Tax=Persicimonas caeni TaxID=2292766 RepID=A0A4Y6PPF8_PERCE|nr:hypothetical protein [Persicimonas caeni]QDG50222.1 hypothetical protein FIV42_05605 [Persicimonas caeni]QED31443.1 hypothetical protein FRD00_05600 [Persicimonas caeni]
MYTPSTRRLVLPLALVVLVFGLVLSGCQQSKLRGMNNDQTQKEEEENENTEVTPSVDEEGHGTSPEEEELVEPGFMNGSWRVATTDQDTPAVYFDTFQDKGDTTVTGQYLMALGIYERLDGESGDIQEGSFDGNTLTLKWNPTNDQEEVLTLQATKTSEDTLEGNVTAKRNVEMDIPVKVTRRLSQGEE